MAAGEVARHREESIGCEGVRENIYRARDTLVLQTGLPEGRECENAVGVAIENVEESLGLHRIDLIAVDPELEGAREGGLADLL